LFTIYRKIVLIIAKIAFLIDLTFLRINDHLV